MRVVTVNQVTSLRTKITPHSNAGGDFELHTGRIFSRLTVLLEIRN